MRKSAHGTQEETEGVENWISYFTMEVGTWGGEICDNCDLLESTSLDFGLYDNLDDEAAPGKNWAIQDESYNAAVLDIEREIDETCSSHRHDAWEDSPALDHAIPDQSCVLQYILQENQTGSPLACVPKLFESIVNRIFDDF